MTNHICSCVYTCSIQNHKSFKTLAMDEEEVVVAAIIVSAVILSNKNCKKRKRRSAWLQRHSSHGFYTQLLYELRLEEREIYENYLTRSCRNNKIRHKFERINTSRNQTCHNYSFSRDRK